MVLAVSNTALIAAALDAVVLASGKMGGRNVGTYLRHVILYEGLSCPCSSFNLILLRGRLKDFGHAVDVVE
jgi:hypothetical protein